MNKMKFYGSYIVLSWALLASSAYAALMNVQPESISFCIADLKFNDSTLKILEFGEGGRSKFKGYDALCGSGAMWAYFWNYLSQFKLPMWLVSMPQDDDLLREINAELFTALGGRQARSITDLELKIESDIKERLGRCTDQDCKEYAAVVLIKKGRPILTVKKMKARFPNVVFIGQQSNKYVNNKLRMDTLFTTDELRKYRPQCAVCSTEYNPSLADQLIQNFRSDLFVIKPVNSSRGRGIMMVDKQNLDLMLRQILTNREELLNPDLSEELQYWATCQSPHFLVEQYEASKPVMVNGEPYDATMRLVFAIDYTGGKLNITVFDGYWKLPAYPVTADCSLTDKHKSHIIPGLLSSVPIDENDKAQASMMLKDALEKVYMQILFDQCNRNSGAKIKTLFDIL